MVASAQGDAANGTTFTTVSCVYCNECFAAVEIDSHVRSHFKAVFPCTFQNCNFKSETIEILELHASERSHPLQQKDQYAITSLFAEQCTRIGSFVNELLTQNANEDHIKAACFVLENAFNCNVSPAQWPCVNQNGNVIWPADTRPQFTTSGFNAPFCAGSYVQGSPAASAFITEHPQQYHMSYNNPGVGTFLVTSSPHLMNIKTHPQQQKQENVISSRASASVYASASSEKKFKCAVCVENRYFADEEKDEHVKKHVHQRLSNAKGITAEQRKKCRTSRGMKKFEDDVWDECFPEDTNGDDVTSAAVSGLGSIAISSLEDVNLSVSRSPSTITTPECNSTTANFINYLQETNAFTNHDDGDSTINESLHNNFPVQKRSSKRLENSDLSCNICKQKIKKFDVESHVWIKHVGRQSSSIRHAPEDYVRFKQWYDLCFGTKKCIIAVNTEVDRSASGEL